MPELEKIINYNFNDKKLLKQSLTHRSYVNENQGEHNERLEFLGDAVLQLKSADFLYNKYKDFDEGILTLYRAALVKETVLSQVAAEINISEYMYFSKAKNKILEEGGHAVTADAIESLIGAIYLDGGLEKANKFIDRFILVKINEVESKKLWVDPKTYLQNESQSKLDITPVYKVIEELGSDHMKKFKVGVYLDNKKIAEGFGRSKQKAEKDAARKQ